MTTVAHPTEADNALSGLDDSLTAAFLSPAGDHAADRIAAAIAEPINITIESGPQRFAILDEFMGADAGSIYSPGATAIMLFHSEDYWVELLPSGRVMVSQFPKNTHHFIHTMYQNIVEYQDARDRLRQQPEQWDGMS